jgi:hypothetical protein
VDSEAVLAGGLNDLADRYLPVLEVFEGNALDN